MSAFNGLKPCRCGEHPILTNEQGRVFFECACKSVKAKPVWQSRGAADKARDNWNRSVG